MCDNLEQIASRSHLSPKKTFGDKNMSDELDKTELSDIVFDDSPRDLRPDLSLYGIEEVDRGVCEDSYENLSLIHI